MYQENREIERGESDFVNWDPPLFMAQVEGYRGKLKRRPESVVEKKSWGLWGGGGFKRLESTGGKGGRETGARTESEEGIKVLLRRGTTSIPGD